MKNFFRLLGVLSVVACVGAGAYFFFFRAVPSVEPDKNTLEYRILSATFIDVRSPDEFNADHVSGAINIPLAILPEHLEELRVLPRPIVVYCNTGFRSTKAKMLLENANISDVYNGINQSQLEVLLTLALKREAEREKALMAATSVSGNTQEAATPTASSQ